MRAVLVRGYSSVGEVSVQEALTPTLSDGNVSVEVAAAGLGFVGGLKIKGLYQTKDPLPFMPGMEFAGMVKALGDHVSPIGCSDSLNEAHWPRRSLLLPKPDGFYSGFHSPCGPFAITRKMKELDLNAQSWSQFHMDRLATSTRSSARCRVRLQRLFLGAVACLSWKSGVCRSVRAGIQPRTIKSICRTLCRVPALNERNSADRWSRLRKAAGGAPRAEELNRLRR